MVTARADYTKLDVANSTANSNNLTGSEIVVVSGSGVAGVGAVTNSNAAVNQQNALKNLAKRYAGVR